MKGYILREVPLVAAFLVAALSALSSFVLHLSVDQVGAIDGVLVVLAAGVVGLLTGDSVGAVILKLLGAAFAVALAFHFGVSPENQTIITAVVVAAIAAFARTQVVAPVPPADAPAPVKAPVA